MKQVGVKNGLTLLNHSSGSIIASLLLLLLNINILLMFVSSKRLSQYLYQELENI